MLLLCLVPWVLIGCSTPEQVRVADDMADAELARYVENTDAIFDAMKRRKPVFDFARPTVTGSA